MTTTTTPNETNDRSSGMPSSRDFEIFRLAVIKGFTHKELAGLFEISRRRVSQIVDDVRNWLAQNPCEDPNISTELQNKRLAQHLERMHLEDIISQARHEVSFGKRQLITTTEKSDGTKTTTYREQPFNVQVLKTYLRAVEALGRINARPEIPLPPPPGDEFPWLMTAINETYEKWYIKISSKRLNADMIDDFVNDMAAEMLKAAKHHQELAARPVEPAPGDDEALPHREGEAPTWEGEAPAEPAEATQARTANEGHRSEHASDSSIASPSTEYSAPSTAESSPDSSFILHHSSFAPPSRASLPEAPESQQSDAIDEATTPDATNTSVSLPSAETMPTTAPPSQENPKREAPPLASSPSLCPFVSPSPSPPSSACQ